MLGIRLQSILFWARSLKTAATQTQPQPIINMPVQKKQQPQQVVKGKLARLHKQGPQLQITKILIKHGPLTSREIWRSYQITVEDFRSNKIKFTSYFSSLSNLKRTLAFMRTNGKILSNGYDRKKKAFKGWKIDQKRALKFVHPDVIADLQDFKKKRNQL